MGVPFSHVEMTDHPQYITVRNTKVCLLAGELSSLSAGRLLMHLLHPGAASTLQGL